MPASQPVPTSRRGLPLGSVGRAESPVEVAPEFLLVLAVDQLEDALVHDICLEEKAMRERHGPPPGANFHLERARQSQILLWEGYGQQFPQCIPFVWFSSKSWC